jgi:hypothetical protein
MNISVANFFSVSTFCTILGKQCRPGICYRMSEDIRASVEGLVAKNLAVIYDEEVRIVTGRAIPVRKKTAQPDTVAAPVAQPAVAAPAKPVRQAATVNPVPAPKASPKKTGKRGARREFA